MDIAYICKLPFNSDIVKIHKFFDKADDITVAVGDAGIAFCSTTKNEECYYMVKIHESDIYQYHLDTSSPPWERGGLVRVLSGASFTNFIKRKSDDRDVLEITIDKQATELRLAVLSGSDITKNISIPLSIPDGAYAYPKLTNANVVMSVNSFKKLCNDMSKSQSNIRIESQKSGIRLFTADQKNCPGTWTVGAETFICEVKPDVFAKATKINIGNTRNTNSGIYVEKGKPALLRAKLGMCDFLIYTKTSEVQ